MNKFLLDPKVFNYIIMTLYGLNAIRWFIVPSYADMFYWLFALGITATVTWGYMR